MSKKRCPARSRALAETESICRKSRATAGEKRQLSRDDALSAAYSVCCAVLLLFGVIPASLALAGGAIAAYKSANK